MKNFYVIEGEHTDPNQIETLLKKTEKKYGPFEEIEANQFAKSLIQKNIDDFYHRAWVLKSDNLYKRDLFSINPS
jgi:hypothetical protein|tara:strand:+ start:1060 stop:1284 length:225 start_codon:yes stop_codon:yes gene_type:complete